MSTAQQPPVAQSGGESACAGLPSLAPGERQRLLTELLRGVSRAFYLTLRVLPDPLREPIGLAYLLARTADTIADTRLLPPAERLRHLRSFRAQTDGPAEASALQAIEHALRESPDRSAEAPAKPQAQNPTNQEPKAKSPSPITNSAERVLLQSLPSIFALLEAQPEADRARIRRIVETLTRGMEFDLETFPSEDSGALGALPDAAALDRYIYYVAGCVGEFWTESIAAHTPALKSWDLKARSATGVRFGKALQLTNVLRDVPRDLRIGRCYLPEKELAAAGIAPAELLDPQTAPKARPVLAAWLRTALEHYRAAQAYTLSIPRRCVRLRLAVLWPILIGLGTLEKAARNAAWLNPEHPAKVTRAWVYRMMLLSLPAVCSNALLRCWIGRLRRKVEAAL